MYKFLKRIMDFIISLISIVMLVPFLFIIALLIKLDDKDNIFYSAERIGKDCKKIKMYKFRTMKENCEDIRNADGSTYNSEDDPRVTKIGKVLRKTSLDELPQLFNVLIGEMSIIGPRASEWNSLNDYLPEELDKMKVKPGITGYTQAYYRNSLSLRDKRKYDVWYANNMGFLLDTKIFFKTIITVLKKENIYTNTKKRGKL